MNLSDTFQGLTQREKVLLGVLGITVLIAGCICFFPLLAAEKHVGTQVVISPPTPVKTTSITEVPVRKALHVTNIKNPFQVPPQYQVRQETAQSGLPGQKTVSSIPALRGIIISGPVKMVILELGGNSDTFGVGNTLGGYTVVSIADTQVVLNGPEGRQVLNIGR